MSCVSRERDVAAGAALLEVVLGGVGLWGARWLGVRVLALSSSACLSASVSEGLLELGVCCWGGRIPAASITEGWLLFLVLVGVGLLVFVWVFFSPPAGSLWGGTGVVLAGLAPNLG